MTGDQWSAIGDRLPITDYRLPITDHRSPITDHRSPITGVDLLTVVMHELGHLLGSEHSEDEHDLMAPVVAAGSGKYEVASTKYEEVSGSSFALRPARSLDGAFAELGEDSGSAAGTSGLPASQDGELLAVATTRPSDETTRARVHRRSRRQRYERDLDALFAELATEESSQ